MRIIQDVGPYERQFREIVPNAIDRRQFADVVTPGADVEFSIEHGLGFIPLGYLIVSQDKPGVTYNSTTAWDTNNIYLKNNVSTVALRVMVF